MKTMAECLPRICEAMCNKEHHVRSDDPFRLNTNGSCRIARLYMDKYYVAFKLQELCYLKNMFHVDQNQLNSFIAALPDDMILCNFSTEFYYICLTGS